MKTFGAILIVLVIIVGIAIWASSQKSPSNNTTKETSMTNETNDLKIEDLKVGDGAQAQTGNTIKVNYSGTLTDGTKFDNSYDRNEPFEFTLGQGQVIQGWEQGFVGMKVGGKRRLTIPPSLGYGDQANDTIPANSTLIFEVELLEVK